MRERKERIAHCLRLKQIQTSYTVNAMKIFYIELNSRFTLPPSHSFDSAYWRIWNVWAYGFIWFSVSLCGSFGLQFTFLLLGTNVPQELNAHEVYRHFCFSFFPCSLLYCVQIHPIQSHFHCFDIVVAFDLVYVCLFFFVGLIFLSLSFSFSIPTLIVIRWTIVIICPFKLQQKHVHLGSSLQSGLVFVETVFHFVNYFDCPCLTVFIFSLLLKKYAVYISIALMIEHTHTCRVGCVIRMQKTSITTTIFT